jgi:quinolinate synthase
MKQIDFPYLVWALESLVSGRLVNQVKVKYEWTKYTKVAFEQVLTQP